ncbi:MAG: DUF4351 domain-containing protein [Clostridiaceae bacterium]
MLAKKNENIKSAYHILQKMSRNKEARMAYEARQAEIMDQLTREKTAKEEGMAEGIVKGRMEGIVEGIAKGKAEVLIKQIIRKFKSVPQNFIDEIKSLPEDIIEKIATDIFDIDKLEDLEKYFKR